MTEWWKLFCPYWDWVFGSLLAYAIGKGKSEKTQRIIQGRTFMLVFAPFFSWFIGGLYAVFGTVETAGWAVVVYPMLLFPVIFLAGAYLFIKGLIKKQHAE